jgi:predicted nucleic acid-binding protein
LGVFYLDTSALVKLYVREPGTEQMLRLADPAGGHTLALLGLTRVEFRSAVRQRERAGDLAHDIAARLIDSLMLRARLGRHATFVCSDRQLAKAAEDEGMKVLDPSVEA